MIVVMNGYTNFNKLEYMSIQYLKNAGQIIIRLFIQWKNKSQNDSMIH